jgi:hypothetical protein
MVSCQTKNNVYFFLHTLSPNRSSSWIENNLKDKKFSIIHLSSPQDEHWFSGPVKFCLPVNFFSFYLDSKTCPCSHLY